MSFTITTDVFCDGPNGCSAWVHGATGTKPHRYSAVQFAKRQGWAARRGKHLCPACAKKDPRRRRPIVMCRECLRAMFRAADGKPVCNTCRAATGRRPTVPPSELRECLRLAWEFTESALGYDSCDDNPDVEHRGLAKANIARIKKALGEA